MIPRLKLGSGVGKSLDFRAILVKILASLLFDLYLRYKVEYKAVFLKVRVISCVWKCWKLPESYIVGLFFLFVCVCFLLFCF